VAYTVVMFALTFVTFVSIAVVQEATMVEAPEGTPETSESSFFLCAPWSITNMVGSTLQFLLSDALLVMTLNLRPSLHFLTVIARCIGHIFCSGVRKLT
jgi:hypothetical protein